MLVHKILTINATPDIIFGYWADFNNFQEFIPIIERIDVINDRLSRWAIRTPVGRSITFESLITVFEPGQRLVWESSHTNGYAKGDVLLADLGDQTRVELKFEYKLHKGWMQNLSRLAGHFGFPSVAFDHGLARIKEKIEADADSWCSN